MVMSHQSHVYISRDNYPTISETIQIWFEEPEFIEQGMYKMFTDAPRFVTISVEDAARLGDEFVVKPGKCKMVMMAVVR